MGKNVNKNLVTVGLVMAGVIGAGYAMSKFRDVKFIAESRNGFQGIA